MGLADTALRDIVDSVAFRASAAPYLLLDMDLRIRGANLAYQRATLHDTWVLTDELLFDVFPDNPATPQVRGAERLATSIERALVNGAPDRMELQRYDVRDVHTDAFIEKIWLPTNSPIRDPDGRTLGVLHHVEDVTHLLVVTELEHQLNTPLMHTGPRRVVDVQALAKAAQQDSMARRERAQLLMDRSREAVARMSRQIDLADR